MALYKEWEPGAHSLAAIWKIEEPESFFREATGLSPEIKNDKKRIEHLAGRYLLKYLEEDFPIHHIRKDQHDKPRIEQDEYFFSISHSWPYVAALIDTRSEAGIDIQTWHPRISDIRNKYLSAEEQETFTDPTLLTVAWTAKEAAYKWNGKRGVDFIQHLPIENFNLQGERSGMTIYFKLSKIPKMIFIENIINTDFTCSYVAYTQDWAIY